MCAGAGVELNDDHRRKIAAGVTRYWSSEDGRAERMHRQEVARQARLAKAKALLTASDAVSNH
jgi:hypothetical protein